MKDEVYRVVQVGDETGHRWSGHNNATGLFNSLAGAKGAVRRSKLLCERRNEWARTRALRTGETSNEQPIPEFKIQRSALVWEDVE
jgi:hypothetical protein